MVTPNPIAVSLLFLCILCSLQNGHAYEKRKAAEGHHPQRQRLRTIQVRSLFASAVCNSSTKVPNGGSSLKVTHRHGPCSHLNQDKAGTLSAKEILLLDQIRVNSIHSRISENSNSHHFQETKATALPVKSGATIGSANFVVTIGLGTPKKDLTLVFDTGSTLTWIQCEPCVNYCYKQVEPKFNPLKSTSYKNISCNSAQCNLLSSSGYGQGCSSTSSCLYVVQYGDNSYSVGFWAKEKLTITSSEVFGDFIFGCGENNRGLFSGAAGLLGLGRDKISFVSQTAQSYKKIFSYCLPSTSSETGHLTFGGKVPSSVQFTPISSSSEDNPFYGLDVTGISVGGTQLSIAASVFSKAGAIIDSGTVITRLPPDAYSSLKAAFRRLMSDYPLTDGVSILDTCYDFSNYDRITVPIITVLFKGGVEVDVDFSGTFLASSLSKVCLAFAANSDENDTAILGNTQQKTLEVVHDVARGRIGFGANGCS